MHTLYIVFLLAHIGGGIVALSCALIALATKKGRPRHRTAGRVFVYAMFAVFATTLIVVPLSPNLSLGAQVFMALIALFSVWLSTVGWMRTRNRSGHATRTEWALAAAMTALAPLMIAFGLRMVAVGLPLGWTLVVFGGIAIGLGVSELVALRRNAYVGVTRIASHVTYMMGGTTATVTAFAVTALPMFPDLVRWIGPTILLTPVTVVWNIRLRRPRGEADLPSATSAAR